MSIRAALHLLLHAIVPATVAWIFFRERWKSAWLVMLLGWAIDADHLLADPVYEPGRCSIGFHPLHTAPAIGVYLALLLPHRTRLLAIGLLIHIALDGLDCALM